MASIHAIIPDKLKHELEEEAQNQQVSLSEVIRMRLSTGAPRYELPTEDEASKEFSETAMQGWRDD